MSAVSEQLAKLNPNSGAQQLLGQIHSEQAARRQALAPADDPNSLANIDAQRTTHDADQARLEAEHGMLATAGTQFGKGVLDTLLAPAALVAAPLEGAGIAFNSPGLEDFGRGFGKAANSDSALEAASFLFGGGGKAGLTTAERVARDTSEQQKAWPTLSTVSHTAGMIAPALVGGSVGVASRVGANVALGAAEAASAGAQSGYANNMALRDIAASALIGAALGAGTAGIGEGLHAIVNSSALKAATRELAEDANLTAAGVSRKGIASHLVDDAGAVDSKATELAGALSDYRFQTGDLEGKPLMRMLRTPDGIQAGVKRAAQETSDALQNARVEIADKLRSNPELLASVEQKFSQAAGYGDADKLATGALEALGGDVAGYQQLASQAKSFAELGQLIQASAGKASTGTLGDTLGTLATVGGLVKGLSAPHVLAAGLLTKVAHKAIQQRSASTVAALANMLVVDNVSHALEKSVATVLDGAVGNVDYAGTLRSLGVGSASAAGGAVNIRPDPITPEKQQERYREQLDKVNEAVNNPDLEARADLIDKVGDFPAPFVIAAGADMSAKMAQLHLDMPKPIPNIRGKAYETLSSQQVQLANAMYEATTNPMSVFSDFAAGSVDYDKVKYAWKQYPALQTAAQAGMMDILQTRLDDKTRGAIPDGMLTQLDNLFGFEGKLQPSLNRGFASRMDALMQPPPEQPKPQSSGPLKLPGSQPTFTERLSGQR